MKSHFDPITLEILWRRLISIVDEADESVARTAFSSLLRDAHDYTCMFTDRFGRELAQGSFCTPGQAGAMAIGIKKMVANLFNQNLRPGDVFITNDPWALAGHLNDVCVLSPIFYKEKLTAFTACVFHHSDIGGRVSSDNHDVFEDGLFIPLVKLYEAGELNQAVIEMIRWNVRTPDEVVGDIRSQIAANHVCSEKLCRMLDDYKMEGLDDLASEVVEHTENSMRKSIQKIPNGVYRAQGHIEQVEGRDDIVVKAKVTVENGGITVDLDGSSDQVDWGGNVVYNFTYAYVFMALKSIFDPELPNNHGCSRPITLKAPEGTIVNCKFPAPVAARMQIGHFITEIIYRAFSEVLPERVIAACGGTPAAMNVFYGMRNNASPFHSVIIRGGGMGASADSDGAHVFLFPANGANTPVEIFESDTPLIIGKRSIIANSCGPGRRQGGFGKVEIFCVPDDQFTPTGPVSLGIQAGRFRYPPKGLSGGKSGLKAEFSINGKTGNPYGLTRLKAGDMVTMGSAGGGGFGDPLTRDPQLVLEDVIDGYITTDFAIAQYGVVIDPVALAIDREATRQLRSGLQNA